MANEIDTPTSSDWSAQATDQFVSLIDTVKQKATGPAITVVRAIVHGLLIAVVGVAALVLFVVGAVRLVNSYLPGDVWAAHLLLGTLFSLVGFFLWSKRRP